MIDKYDIALQIVVAYAVAVSIYLLGRKLRQRILIGALLSALISAVTVVAIAIWIHGVTSTLGIGFVFSFIIGLVTAGAVLTVLRIVRG